MELAGLELKLPEAIMLRDALRKDRYTLTRLDLSGNLLDDRAVAVVADVAATHPNLDAMDLSRNAAGPAGLARV